MRRLLVLALAIASSACLRAADDYREVEPSPAPGDKAGIWTLNFRYKPPRIVTVDVPGKGKQQVWYMPFQIYNRTENPQLVVPVFTLVTKDLNTNHKDEPQPAIFKAVEALEDPTGILKMKSTINISKEKIPMTKPDSFPRYVSGIAIWTDVPERAAKTNRFSVYVSGLSDGLVIEEEKKKDDKDAVPTADDQTDIVKKTVIIKTKTLQLDFFKPTDDIDPKPGDIKPEDNGGLGGERWIYRVARQRKADAEPMEKKEN